ncbi:MAG: hypothetical protein IRY99_23170, partial [Isosphaeraceae bacterium]|nr:hypothetical protein [Isosphaeraceae bacterium]
PVPAAPGEIPGSGPGQAEAPGGAAGYGDVPAPGGGDAGGAGASDGPADFKNPVNAARAFLNALKAKDLERLAEATALRSTYESSGSHRELFKAILDTTLSEEDLDELAKAFEGFEIYRLAQAQSTGQQGVILAKNEGRDHFERTLYIRREKAGWKVLDFSKVREFRPTLGRPSTGSMPIQGGMGRGGYSRPGQGRR